MSDTRHAPDPTIDENAVAHFGGLAAQWWDPRSKMGVLHKFNPVRLDFIKDTICRYSSRDPKQPNALSGLRILDIGCGAGVLSENRIRT
jgi:2-polyprenyl-6-hydroxyphenyl methylase / 3-demethylubiquinone-9 3-methyltransferase